MKAPYTLNEETLVRVGGWLVPDEPARGLTVDVRYRVSRTLGRGGMASVFEVFDERLGRTVAMKVMSGLAFDEALLKSFRQEVETLSRLDHPGVALVHDCGLMPDGRPYYTMKLVKGQTLARLLVQDPDPVVVLRILRDVCLAVASGHASGVIHCDLKPGNIMIDDSGHAYVLDWGIARVIGRLSQRARGEQSRTVFGTPGYAAPEVERGEVELGPNVDVYSVGKILKVWLCDRERRGSFRPLPREPHLQAISRRASAEDASDRHPSLDELAADLHTYLRDCSTPLGSEHLRHRVLRSVGWAVQLCAVFGLLVLLFLLSGFWRPDVEVGQGVDQAIAWRRSVERCFAEALFARQEGNVPVLQHASRELLARCEEAPDEEVQQGQAAYYRGRTWRLIGDPAQALEAFARALELDPANRHAAREKALMHATLLREAHLDARARRLALARLGFEYQGANLAACERAAFMKEHRKSALETLERHQDRLSHAVRVWLRSGRSPDTLPDEVALRDPLDRADLDVWWGFFFLDSGGVDRARDALDGTLAREPAHAQAYFMRAYQQYFDGTEAGLRMALRDCEKALSLIPRRAFRVLHGNLLVAMRRYPKALEAYARLRLESADAFRLLDELEGDALFLWGLHSADPKKGRQRMLGALEAYQRAELPGLLCRLRLGIVHLELAADEPAEEAHAASGQRRSHARRAREAFREVSQVGSALRSELTPWLARCEELLGSS